MFLLAQWGRRGKSRETPSDSCPQNTVFLFALTGPANPAGRSISPDEKDPTMAQSLSSILVHLIFSTKNREPLIRPSVEPRVHEFMAGIFRDLQCPALTIGSMPDHVHILFSLARTISICDVVEDVKKRSSKWIKTLGPEFDAFYWQLGYGAFSIGQSGVDETRHYIDNQAEHHRVRSFQDEFRAFLGKYEVEFDERYVWD
jgi:putative transposase